MAGLREAFERVHGEHAVDAGHRPRLLDVDAHDARMRLLAAAERDVQHAGQRLVVDVGAASGEQARVLDALDPRADELRPQVAIVRGVACRVCYSYACAPFCSASHCARSWP